MGFSCRLAALALGATLLIAGAADVGAQSRTRVMVYTATETEELSALKAAIETDLPDIEVQWVRDSTGVITARLMAERDSPRADMVFGLVTSSLLLLERMNLLEAYRPQGAEGLKPAFQDTSEPYSWTGLDAFVIALCFNTVEAGKANIPKPESWGDLIHPSLRSRLVMPHPASSGTGFLIVASWIQIMGEDAAWRYMEALDRNVSLYTHSGSAPCVQAARGERVIGISFDMRAARERSLGAPIDIIVPRDGVGWEMGALAIIRGRPPAQAAAARRIADWATGRNANELFARFYGIVARPGIVNVPPNYPTDAESRMIQLNYTWMADNRDRILAEWSKRFENRPPQRN
ncbi:putative 2-aminoethylphosphonate ABC transporter substrate-binding protein [Phreatobacter stygius]|uniref:Putative 2-aminoethylphosphonate ABC transporter substrate-binding protein n=1 Tax=Phreatobacter stygius TaxID=1940610 RepID=A0A4D7B310_9HYPH|nr:putative 2-aminoethylphosphonate ABC transporter substrate-binding protein [Phreatobacter stygius]QCI65443.1 putative 2-aminoethylphosphonate ABC transporter substrate-binding protein [Phreatobacter stygius]